MDWVTIKTAGDREELSVRAIPLVVGEGGGGGDVVGNPRLLKPPSKVTPSPLISGKSVAGLVAGMGGERLLSITFARQKSVPVKFLDAITLPSVSVKM
jgi:hypothetical protein